MVGSSNGGVGFLINKLGIFVILHFFDEKECFHPTLEEIHFPPYCEKIISFKNLLPPLNLTERMNSREMESFSLNFYFKSELSLKNKIL